MATVTPSGNIATALNNIFGESGLAINVISEMAGALADASGAIGGVVALVETLINLGQPDEIQAKLDAILNAIKDNFHSLNEDLKANQILERNTQLKAAFDQAATQLKALEAAINSHPSPFEVVQFIEPCIKALADLGGGPPEGPIDFAWNMNFDWQVYWTDEPLYESGGNNEQYGLQAPGWNPDGATVFVYTYSLPLYLFTVAIFIAVAGSLDGNFITNYGNTVLRPAAALLRAKYDLILQEGLTRLSPRPPASNDSFLTGVGIVVFAGGPILIRYGAVEKFSGYSSVGTYKIDLPPTFPFGYTILFNKLQLRLLKRTKDVYIGAGMTRVWGLINKLNGLVGDAPLPFPNSGDWSFRECLQVSKLGETNSSFSLRALAEFLINTPPFDTPYPVESPMSFTISFKELLTNFNEDLASPPILGPL